MAQKTHERPVDNYPVLDLSIGKPGCHAPDHIKMAGVNAINKNVTKYTPANGVPSLQKTIKSTFVRKNNLNYELNEITIDVGAKQLIFGAFFATVLAFNEIK